jgi:osmoprotectant transport system permease protein
MTATLLCLVLALALDLAIAAIGRGLTPWTRGKQGTRPV